MDAGQSLPFKPSSRWSIPLASAVDMQRRVAEDGADLEDLEQLYPEHSPRVILWDLSHPTKRLSYPVPLSCPLRVYISVAPQLTPTYPLEPIYPLGSTWASYQVPPPVILHISPLGHGAGWCRVPRWVF